jgi:hypothetical protein
MNELEKKEFKDIVKAFGEEEILEAVRLIPGDYLWNELIRRNTKMLKGVNYIEEILGTTVDNLQPIPIVAWEDMKRRYDDLENKFAKIRKGFGI